MASLDEIFYKEFTHMMHNLKGMTGQMSLYDIELPEEVNGKFFVEHREKVVIGGINDEYYGKLNNSEALLWGSKALRRRIFDHNGEFIKTNTGDYVLEDVPCPRECVAIISPLSIGVPNKYKTKEHFDYVDMVTKNIDGRKVNRFVYLIPRQYCYKIAQTALILSWNKMKVFYSGASVAMQNGHVLYIYTIPYKPSNLEHNYRILHTKTSDDYSEELQMLVNFWIGKGIIFNPADCAMMDTVKGIENMAYQPFDGVLDVYERFDTSKSMAHEESIEEVDYV